MANNKEAKITFKAETAEFTAGIKEMNSNIGTLNKQLNLNATQLKANGDSVELLEINKSYYKINYKPALKK